MNFIKQNSLFFSIASFIFIYSSSMFASGSELNANVAIVANSIKDTEYQAIITLKNYGQSLSRGWQLAFKFSSPDQSIKKISGGIATKNQSYQIINNLPQHIRTAKNQSRIIKITVNKNSSTVPAVPTITVTADTSNNNSDLTIDSL